MLPIKLICECGKIRVRYYVYSNERSQHDTMTHMRQEATWTSLIVKVFNLASCCHESSLITDCLIYTSRSFHIWFAINIRIPRPITSYICTILNTVGDVKSSLAVGLEQVFTMSNLRHSSSPSNRLRVLPNPCCLNICLPHYQLVYGGMSSHLAPGWLIFLAALIWTQQRLSIR